MSEIKTGGQAFPSNYTLSDGALFIYNGMTMRDYFAAKAMQSLIEKSTLLVQTILKDGSHHGSTDEFMDIHRKGISESAYQYADAMLAEREKGE